MGLLEQLLEMIPDVVPVESVEEEAAVEDPEPQVIPEVKVVREVAPIEEQAVNEEFVTEDTTDKKFKINPREMIIYSEIMKPKYLD